ncbi:FkbM family methyltransferase [Polynucleobacter paneuropaeus]|nr:FkbM family methyltransferase [Polynucleobacter paneuropaeus]QWD09511.1 FkbM family methyltransferase [Polynucleobacter paneuropaeus]
MNYLIKILKILLTRYGIFITIYISLRFSFIYLLLLFKRSIQINWINDVNIIISKSDKSLLCTLYLGLPEIREQMFLMRTLTPKDLFIDVGACTGSFSLLAGCVCNSNILSFEPVHSSYTRLIENLNINIKYLNQKNNNITLQKIVSNKHTSFFISNNNGVQNKVSLEDNLLNSNYELIETCTLDDFNYNEYQGIFLKIDVEGFESFVLDGAKKLLSNPNLYAICIETAGHGSKFGKSDFDLLEIIKSYGFIPINFSTSNQHINEDKAIYENTILIRDFNEIEGRLLNNKNLKINIKSVPDFFI